MKKTMLVLLFVGWIFLGKMSLEKWSTVPDKPVFLRQVCIIVSINESCKGDVSVLYGLKDIYFFGSCVEKKSEL